jgi:hypothetical protein
MAFITRAATVPKSNLLEISTLRGRVNRSAVTFADDRYDAEALVFVGFAGTRHDDGLYHGEYRFREATNQDDDAERIDFSKIPGLLKVSPSRKESEVKQDVV